MRTTSETLFPVRFLATVGHFMATIMVFYTKDGNLIRAMPLRDISQYDAFNASFVAALALTWICFSLEFAGMFLGLTLFNSGMNLIYILAHISATISLSFFITEAWNYYIYWYIFAFCNAIPEIMELIIILSRRVLRL
ncbi:transmembrane protein [Chytriomyces sp. MP71]|nr:transmembrane protein [Chytriomyces sp. MP71]